jgi:branched-chain amino acid transport system substrate-binding protein
MNRREFLRSAGAAGLGMALTSAPWKVLGGSNAFAAAGRKVVHFGGSLALTGTYAKVAKMYKDAYELYLDSINHKMTIAGQPYEVKLTMYDDENDPVKAAQLTEKLINVDKVDLILEAYGTDPVLAQLAIAKKYNRVVIGGGAATRRTDEEFGGHTAYTVISTGDYYHKPVIELASTLNPPIKTVGIITMDDPIYQEMAKASKERCAQLGMQVVFEDVIPMNTSDLSSTVLKMKGKQIDMVINTGWDKILASFVNEAIKYKLNLKLLDGGHGTLSPSLAENLGKRLKNIVGITFWLAEAKSKPLHYKNGVEYSNKFKARFGYAPDYHSVHAALTMELYEVILKDANPKDPFNSDYMRKALMKVDRDMISGHVRFNAKGRCNTDMLVIQWQGDPAKPVIVAPKASANGKIVYPSNPLGA